MIPCFANIGTGELIVILVVFLLLFGAKRIPELAKSIGKGIGMFKQGLNETVNLVNEPVEKPTAEKQTEKSTSEADEK